MTLPLNTQSPTLPGGSEFTQRKFEKFLFDKPRKLEAGPRDKVVNAKFSKTGDLIALKKQLSVLPLSQDSSELEKIIVRFFVIRDFLQQPADQLLKIEHNSSKRHEPSTLVISYLNKKIYEYVLKQQYEQQQSEILINHFGWKSLVLPEAPTYESTQTFAKLCSQQVTSHFTERKEVIKAQLKIKLLAQLKPDPSLSNETLCLQEEVDKLENESYTADWRSQCLFSCNPVDEMVDVFQMSFANEDFYVRLPPLVLALAHDSVPDSKGVDLLYTYLTDRLSYQNLDEFLDLICSTPKAICTQDPIYSLLHPLKTAVKTNAKLECVIKSIFSQCYMDGVNLWQIFEFIEEF
ncbi:hypothetical protein D5R81_06685 [Parashewanella spongiae]|uniref:Uncharacterized protein n=1 Tax=Parashewanella spongiae TaxID=342950 RepID=A0A3A6U286_9GAMM|nr:hypothetical protein [Parashewanella spongiae]MCL1077650.1 hypothetical protein [Parashewanella spongiae]RJY18123.1 hypothetical protein D5R81_06685 [Parashewanella spongiae]